MSATATAQAAGNAPPARRKRRKWRPPAPVNTAAALALRVAMSAPIIAGSWAAASFAEGFGRRFSGLWFNRGRFARAMDHLRIAFPRWSEERRRACAEASYGHLFRLAVELVYTPRLFTEDNWNHHLEIGGVAAGKYSQRARRAIALAELPDLRGSSPLGHVGPGLEILLRGRPCIMITGHCGNWEVLGYALAVLGFPMHALYRPLDNRSLDRWVRGQRQRAGLMLLDKFGAMQRLPGLMERRAPIAFVADQNAGDKGIFVPFFGRLASTYKSIGLLAMQYDAPLVVGMALRVPGPEGGYAAGGIRHHVYVADVIEPEDWKAQPDPLFYLTARYRWGLEKMVRTAPEQYLWMHRIWKSRPQHERLGKPVPKGLAAKIRALPWLTADEAEAVIERSERESAERRTQ